MRLLKMLGLAMVAAAAVTAFVGAGTASATLCKVNESPCKSTNEWPAGTELAVKSSDAKLTGSIATDCESLAVLKHEGINAKGELFGKVISLTWSNCTNGCKATTTTLGTFDDKATGGGNGTILMLGVVVVLKGCLGFATCEAEGADVTLTLTGGAVGVANGVADNQPVVIRGFGCGKTGTWNAGGAHGGSPYVLEAINGVKSGSIFIE